MSSNPDPAELASNEPPYSYPFAEFLQDIAANGSDDSTIAPLSMTETQSALEQRLRDRYQDPSEAAIKLNRSVLILQYVRVHMSEFAFALHESDRDTDPGVLIHEMGLRILRAVHEAYCLAPSFPSAEPQPEEMWRRVAQLHEEDRRRGDT